MSLQIDLGRVNAVSVNHDWNLTAKTSIRLHAHISSHPLPSGDLLFWLKQSRPWIGRANGLHVVVQVLQEGRTLRQCGAEQSVLHALRDAVANAELWKQLQLDATLFDLASSPSTHPSSSFTLQIRHATNLDAKEVRRLHRLPVGTSAADLLPPDGIVASGLEQIYIVLDYSRSLITTNSNANAGLSDPPRLEQRHLNTTDAVELADAVFRSIIYPKPSKLSLGIWLPKTAETSALSMIAPTIWSPGYAAAVSERVCFLPIITHALSHSLAGRVRSTGLKEKLLRLQSLADSSATSPATCSPPVIHSLSDLVKAKLWKTVQLGVYKEDASAELKPLTIPEGNLSDIGSQDGHDEWETTNNSRDPAAARLPRSSNDDDIANLLTQSPQLIGSLNLPHQDGWDGGLLAQPVNVHHILAQLERTQSSQVITGQYDHDMSSLLGDDDNDDGLLSSEVNADDAMISDAEEISSIISSDQDDTSILSDSTFDSFLLDDNTYNHDETPQTSQESAVSSWLAGRAVNDRAAEHQQPLPPRPMWQALQPETVDCGARVLHVDDDFLTSDADIGNDDEDDNMLSDWADDYDMLED